MRLTVVDETVVAVGIDSQGRSTTELDWRRDQANIRYFRTHAPADLRRQVLNLMRTFDLKFATMDFIVQPDGDVVFLEINPMGHWLWLENTLKLE